MKPNSSKQLTTICFAAVCFIFCAISSTINTVKANMHYADLGLVDWTSILFGFLEVASYILIIIALVIYNPKLSFAGCGIYAVLLMLYCIAPTVSFISASSSDYRRVIYLFIAIKVLLYAITFIFISLISIKPKSSKTFGYVSAAVSLFRFLTIVIIEPLVLKSVLGTTIVSNTSIFFYIVSILLFPCGAILLGFAYANFEHCKQTNRPSINAYSAPITSNISYSNAETLYQFKTMLDEGLISQVEFEEKKKQLFET